MKLVGHVCHRISIPWNPAIDKEDLLQEGYIGLWKACLTFDKDKGYQFSTYACKCIDSQIRTMLRNIGTIRLPRYLKDIRKALFDHGFTLPLDPKEIDILLSEGKFCRAQLEELMDFQIVSLDSTFSIDGDNLPIMSMIEDQSARIEYQFSDSEIKQIIDEILLYIKPDYKDLVEEWMYAVLEESGMTQSELANKYKISQSYVSKILRSAIYLLRQNSEHIRNLFGI